MTIKTHCDNDNCGETRNTDEDIYYRAASGEIINGWWTISRGDHAWHFHSIHCLQQWAFERASKESLKAEVSR